MVHHKLDFVIAGAQKSGTTTLDAILRHHPQIQMASIKETHFFDEENRDWANPDYTVLDAFFPCDDDRLRGEATPITLYWQPAIRRLHAYNAALKLIVLLRDPVERTFSNWRKEFTRGKETIRFSDAIRDGRTRVRLAGETEDVHRYFSYVERSLYGRQLAYLVKFFPRDQIHCEIFEEFLGDRAAPLKRLCNFLGVDPIPDRLPSVYENPGRDLPDTLSDADADYLSSLFSGEIAAVEAFLGRSVLAWRTPRTAGAPPA